MKKREVALRLILFLLISLVVMLYILQREQVPEPAPIPQPIPTPLVWEYEDALAQELAPTIEPMPAAISPTEVIAPIEAPPTPSPPPAEKTIIIPDPSEIMRYASEKAILQDCQEVYPTDMEMTEVGKWLSGYWDFLVLEGTGEVGTSQNSPVLFPLPTDGSPKCIIAAYLDLEQNVFLLYETKEGDVTKVPLLPPPDEETL